MSSYKVFSSKGKSYFGDGLILIQEVHEHRCRSVGSALRRIQVSKGIQRKCLARYRRIFRFFQAGFPVSPRYRGGEKTGSLMIESGALLDYIGTQRHSPNVEHSSKFRTPAFKKYFAACQKSFAYCKYRKSRRQKISTPRPGFSRVITIKYSFFSTVYMDFISTPRGGGRDGRD